MVEPVQPMPSYTPGTGLNAIQEDSELEEKETDSRKGSTASGDKSTALPTQLFSEPRAVSDEDVIILSECHL